MGERRQVSELLASCLQTVIEDPFTDLSPETERRCQDAVVRWLEFCRLGKPED